MELGIHTFVDLMADPVTGAIVSPQQRMADLLEEAKLADEVGLDVFGVGEHHRPDYVSSAPAVILAAIAAQTNRLRLTSAVTVLSSDDPVRVFQQYSELDLISNGRAEIMAGRGSFIESFPLFGYNLDDYDDLFSEKLDLLLRIRADEHVTWNGKLRPPLQDAGVYPRPMQDRLPVWIAVGGTPESVFRAGMLGLPLALAIIGGQPARFAPLAALYRESAEAAGHDVSTLKMSINSHGFVSDTFDQAIDDAFPYHALAMNKIGKERGWSPMTRDDFVRAAAPEGSSVLGDPQIVADKIVAQYEIFKHDRFMLQMTVGTMPHKTAMRAIELYGTKVAPLVHAAIGQST